MMSLVFLVYVVFTLIPSIKALTGIGAMLWVSTLPCGLLIGAAQRDMSNGERSIWDFFTNVWYKKWKIALILLVIYKLIPSQEVTAYMIGGYGVQKLSENETVQNLSSDGVDVLKLMMAKAKKELSDDKEKK